MATMMLLFRTVKPSLDEDHFCRSGLFIFLILIPQFTPVIYFYFIDLFIISTFPVNFL